MSVCVSVCVERERDGFESEKRRSEKEFIYIDLKRNYGANLTEHIW